MLFVDSVELAPRQPLAGWNGRFFHSDNMTFAYYEIDADAIPIHEHHQAQEEVRTARFRLPEELSDDRELASSR
jgi:hypothetical protein